MSEPFSTSVPTRLREATEAVYQTFAVPKPAVIEGCPCCISSRGVDVLLTTPLRELTGQDLWQYVSRAFLTVGGERDYRYLLPRILEVSTRDPGNANYPETVIGKLALAQWRSWSLVEQAAIENFLDAWFEHALAQDLAEADYGSVGTETESVLSGLARAGVPLTPWLVKLADLSAEPILTDLKDRFPAELSGFWEFAPQGFRELSTILSQGCA